MASLGDKDLQGLDSEFTYSTRQLVKKFDANGAHLNKWWVMTPVEWECPCCLRKKTEIVRLNKNNYLICQLHEHHDHMKEVVKSLFEEFSTKKRTVVADELSEKFAVKTAFSLSAYDNTVVCFDCNKSDSDAKKIVGAHRYFSFSPKEIGEFILVHSNREHEIDEKAAREVWARVRPIFELRLDMASKFAHIAAEKNDWYQPSYRTAKQIERIAKYYFDFNGLLEIEKYEPERLLYNTEPFKGAHEAWRTKPIRQICKRPTEQEISHLNATRGKYWKRYDDKWTCPCCNRTKYECVRASKRNPWVLEIKSGALFVESKNKVDYRPDPMCADCLDSAISLGREVLKVSGENIEFPSSVVSLAELSCSVVARPHSKHVYKNTYIDGLMPDLVSRAHNVAVAENIRKCTTKP